MKKTAAACLAVLVTVMLCASVSAFVPQKITALHEGFASKISDMRLDGEAIEASGLTQIRAYPSSVLEIALVGEPLNADLFLDQNGSPINTADVTISKMRAANMSVKSVTASGGYILKNLELTVRNAGTPAASPVIRLTFPRECASLEPIDFSATLHILIGGETQEDASFELAGSFGNPEIEVSSSDMTVSAGSAVLLAEESIARISIDAGSGVTVDASMRANKRYLVTAYSSGDGRDLDLIEESIGIVDVIKLDAIGFERNEIKSVSIESDRILQVYDENGKRVGNTLQKLPYLQKYYLADKPVRF